MTESCVGNKTHDTIVRIETTMGVIEVKLYPETPLHRANFLKLVKEGFYSGVLFHRVIRDFMIQTGDPKSKTAGPTASLGAGDVGYTIPAEFVYPKYYHKRGALAAARQGDQTNPKKESSGCQFYIVQGRTFNDQEIAQLEKNSERKEEARLFQAGVDAHKDLVKKYRLERNQAKLDELRDIILADVHAKMKADTTLSKFSSTLKSDYGTLGGTPHLDGDYTVFGEVTKGLEIVDKISKVATGRSDRPVEDVKIIKAEVVSE